MQVLYKRSSSLDTRRRACAYKCIHGGESTCSAAVPTSDTLGVEDGSVIKACRGVDRLLSDLARAMSSPTATRPLDESSDGLGELSRFVRQFVGDSKTLVSGATKSRKALVDALGPSAATLSIMVMRSRGLNISRHRRASHQTPTHAVLLSLVKDVASAYRETLRSADAAAGLDLNHVAMKSLMRRATELAAALSHLLKTLKSFKSM